MAWFICTFVFAAFLIYASEQRSTPQSDTYVAAVVEFAHGQRNPSPAVELDLRTREYVGFIQSEQASDVDIIVFPESTLNTRASAQLVPDPSERIVPCTNASYAGTPLEAISCAASQRKIYVIINLTMKRDCAQERAATGDARACADVWNLYNTNVVFDRTGEVISIYRKWNLFGETGISTTKEPDVSSFETDFGVEFGHFICFDLMFGTPANDLVKKGITNFAFPTMWFSELPFLTAVQAQQGWAFANDVNLLAAGANRASVGSTGSGIYAGRQGALRSLMSDIDQSRMLVSTLKKRPGFNVLEPNEEDNVASNLIPAIYLKREAIDEYRWAPIYPSLFRSLSMCMNDYCCAVSYAMEDTGEVENTEFYQYHILMYQGSRSFDGFRDGDIRICSVIACTSEDRSSCGTVFPNNVKIHQRYRFSTMDVFGSFISKSLQKSVTMPTTLANNLKPLPNSVFSFLKSERDGDPTMNVTMDLPNGYLSKPLLTFGIYSREFSGVANIQASLMLMVVGAIAALQWM